LLELLLEETAGSGNESGRREAVITKPAKPITAAQAMPLKVFDAQPR